ncbi:MAG: FAD-dependent oxidoreductase [Candidatus Gastranaerophilales bacterium]|nr:FAD-dependent oxidoreductase [Candidatus Gastranaerophilales bacterium]
MNYDIVIAGGGTAGCACAYTAANLGLSVLLIEQNSFLGGSMTSALVTPAMKTDSKELNTSFYKKLMNELLNIGGQTTYTDGNIGWFNPELMKIALDTLMDCVHVNVLFNSQINAVNFDKNHIISVSFSNMCHETPKNIVSIYGNNICNKDNMLCEHIETKYLVDATGDAKIFQKLNCNFLENKNNFQPPSLRFIMSGIDIDKFSDWILNIDKDRNVTSSYLIDGKIHLSTACTWDNNKKWALKPIFQQGIDNGELLEDDTNYFQLFTIPGMPSSVAFNCPRIVSNAINPNNPFDVSKALKLGRESIYRLSEFLKKHFTGFKNAYISSIANSLGVRVSNRIKGKYVYTIDDLINGKIFKNPCLISDYPVDIHSCNKDTSLLEHPAQRYMLPIESLMSVDYDNLFAVGRCISADFHAQAALRVIPSCFSMGESLAKYIANLENKQKP